MARDPDRARRERYRATVEKRLAADPTLSTRERRKRLADELRPLKGKHNSFAVRRILESVLGQLNTMAERAAARERAGLLPGLPSAEPTWIDESDRPLLEAFLTLPRAPRRGLSPYERVAAAVGWAVADVDVWLRHTVSLASLEPLPKRRLTRGLGVMRRRESHAGQIEEFGTLSQSVHACPKLAEFRCQGS